MAQVQIFFADGLEEIEGLTVVDLLRRAGISIDIVSITGSRTVTGSHGITITADCTYEEADFKDTQMFVLPGGMPGTKNLAAYQPLCDQLTEAFHQGRYVCAICAAPSVLGGLGLLKDKQATCYPGFEDQLTGAITSTEPVVQDGNIITSRGMGTAIPFAGKLIEVFKDKATADELLASIIYNV